MELMTFETLLIGTIMYITNMAACELLRLKRY
jgi:hypothetical protein